MENIFQYFETKIHTKFIEDITNTVPFDGLRYTMFKSICYNDDDKENYYYAERINIHGKNGLKLGRKNSDEYRLVGFDIEAEDPRLICFQNKIYIIFVSLSNCPNVERGITITEFHHWNPTYLHP
jgi:hypothetical protein